MEESKLRKELKDSESKLNIKHSNNISQTQQEILQDLNLLKNEDIGDDTRKSEDKRKKIHKSEHDQIIEEEHTYETNSIMKNKTYKNKCKINH